MDNGAFIMHRIHGSTTDIQGDRAITKMKATITQRFLIDGCEVDVEADCRFCFFFEKRHGIWGACYVRLGFLVALDIDVKALVRERQTNTCQPEQGTLFG